MSTPAHFAKPPAPFAPARRLDRLLIGEILAPARAAASPLRGVSQT